MPWTPDGRSVSGSGRESVARSDPLPHSEILASGNPALASLLKLLQCDIRVADHLRPFVDLRPDPGRPGLTSRGDGDAGRGLGRSRSTGRRPAEARRRSRLPDLRSEVDGLAVEPSVDGAAPLAHAPTPAPAPAPAGCTPGPHRGCRRPVGARAVRCNRTGRHRVTVREMAPPTLDLARLHAAAANRAVTPATLCRTGGSVSSSA